MQTQNSVTFFSIQRLLTGNEASLAAAAASPLSTDSFRFPSRCGRSGFGQFGFNLAEWQSDETISVHYI